MDPIPSSSKLTVENPSLRPARLSDLPSIARCWYNAFFDDEVIGDIMHPHRKRFPEDVYWFLLRGIRERFWDWRHQFVVVTVREEGRERIVGSADWRRIGDGGKERELWWGDPRTLICPTLSLYHRLSLYIFPNRAADPGRSSFLTSAVASSQKHWTGDRAECWDLYTCGVHPDFQGKGVGKILVDWGLQIGDNEGVCASVICGEKNRGFYGKSGLVEDVWEQGKGRSDGSGIMLFRSARKGL
ncbi:hypothetical protein K469DRAFT_737677 [Zopfia rhizophila CBS 207.26]|uniref:N-acetyltransferase domain-containing protein n=1 Tax=Zopfia rhizophila CBS 207.26 TaxID=1314779 RepID=A0A6A6EBE2_9PEZI|nr:hypothetical protein K469DRAFT_737677 [Zopfia rhizophila CBS 207.26]